MLEHITVSYGIPLAYIGLGIAALSVIVFPVIQMFQDLKKAARALIGLGVIAALFAICYLLADRKDFSIGDIYVSANQMKFVEASIYMVYILLFSTVLAILITPVSRYFNIK